MSPFGDDGGEMPRHRPIDDRAVDALLTGSAPDEELASLSSFVADVRSAAEAVPLPSPALAAALAAGLSTSNEQGDLPVTAASNAHGPAQQAAGLPKWRTLKMKIKGLVAGLGIAGKVALGAGLAAAATTGAGAAGVLPGPVQHAVASAFDTVTPFSMPDAPAEHHDDQAEPGAVTTTTLAEPTSVPEAHDANDDANGGGVVTPTTEVHHDGDGTDATTPTTESHDGEGDATPSAGSHDGEGGDATTPTTTSDNNNPESLSISCAPSTDPFGITCTFTHSTTPGVRYLLLRTSDGRVAGDTDDGFSITDSNVVAGQTYSYRVIAVTSGDQVDSHSPITSATAPAGGNDGGSGDGSGDTTTTVQH